MDLALIVTIGLFTAFWADLATRSDAAPKWLIKIRSWGKPWSCRVCMSFWIAFLAWLAVDTANGYWMYATTGDVWSVLVNSVFAVSASAMISVLIISTMVKLELFIIPSR